MGVKVMMFESEVLGVELPEKVTLEVVEAEPGVKGNTASNVTKNIVVETGYGLQAPMFIEAGEKIIINTSTGEYVSRA
jgi:elongation factor P